MRPDTQWVQSQTRSQETWVHIPVRRQKPIGEGVGMGVGGNSKTTPWTSHKPWKNLLELPWIQDDLTTHKDIKDNNNVGPDQGDVIIQAMPELASGTQSYAL